MVSIKKTRQFIEKDVWKIPLKTLSKPKIFLIRQLRIFLFAIKGFLEDKVQLRSSALTFYTLLSVVPVVAMIFGIAKGFGYENKLKAQLIENFTGQEEVLQKILEFADKMLENTKGGFIAGIGFIILIWSVMKVLGNIERSFNDIWQIKKSRTFVRKFTDYLSMFIIAPITIIIYSSLTVFLTTQLKNMTESVTFIGYLSPFIFLLLGFVRYAIIWLLFTVIYMVMPNTKVNFKSALIAGFIAGIAFLFVQWIYIYFQIGVSKYNTIYGSFAALPLFLIWLETSWLIVLFGAEISFANQNIEQYEHETESLNISSYYKRLLSLRITHLVVKQFEKGDTPLTATEISHVLEVPIKLVREIIYELVECKIFSETVTDSPKESSYQPGIDIGKISVRFVIDRLDKRGNDDISVAKTQELVKIKDILEDFNKLLDKSSSNILLREIS